MRPSYCPRSLTWPANCPFSKKWVIELSNTYEKECQEEICERGPREKELYGVVQELNIQENLAEEVLPWRPYTEPEDSGVNGGEQGTV